jgi:cytochrome oxidase Cu insertion factor (SCO1/SenC/PrrC family)
MRTLVLAIGFVGSLAVASGGWLFPQEPPQRQAAELMDVLMWNREPVGGPFALIDHNNQLRTHADFRDKFMLIYFGFTYCSNVCPTDLMTIAGAIDRLGPLGEMVQPLFVTVNPEFDTPEQLKEYVKLFHPRLIGLTGDMRQIRELISAFKVYYAKISPSKRVDPEIDHTAYIYLMGRDGRYLGFFPPGTSAERMVEIIQLHLEGGYSSAHRSPW